MNDNIEWECLKPNCNKRWFTRPAEIIGKHRTGCIYCNPHSCRLLTNEEIDERIKERKLKRREDYNNSSTKIEWECLMDNCRYIWKATPTNVLNNVRGCPKCTPHSPRPLTNEEFIFKAREIHGEEFEYLESYKGSLVPILMKHRLCGNTFIKQPKPHISKKRPQGCPICKEPLGESIIRKILTKNVFNFGRQKSFDGCIYKRKMRFDFVVYDDSNNILCLIEYQGLDHYPPVDKLHIKNTKRYNWKQYEINKIKDNMKVEYCKENNINLIVIPYWNMSKIEEILRKIIQFKEEIS